MISVWNILHGCHAWNGSMKIIWMNIFLFVCSNISVFGKNDPWQSIKSFILEAQKWSQKKSITSKRNKSFGRASQLPREMNNMLLTDGTFPIANDHQSACSFSFAVRSRHRNFFHLMKVNHGMLLNVSQKSDAKRSFKIVQMLKPL